MKQVTLLLFLFLSTIGFTQLITPFTIRYQVTQKGGIRFLANSSVTCASSIICTDAQDEIPPLGTSRNNNFNPMDLQNYLEQQQHTEIEIRVSNPTIEDIFMDL